MTHRHWNLWIGLFFVAFSVVTLVWWIPIDVETGILVQDRFSIEIGDAMAPTVIAIGILLFSVALIFVSVFVRATANEDVIETATGLTKSNLASSLVMGAFASLSLAIMVWAGPLSVDALNWLGFDVKAYRLLTDTVPYKYIGFAAGGFLMVFSLIAWVEGRPSLKAGLTALGAVTAIILIYDIPFDNLLLPPNGSQ